MTKFDDADWVDDMYDMEEGELRQEAERYANLARRYPGSDKPGYKMAYLRHQEAIKIMEARSR